MLLTITSAFVNFQLTTMQLKSCTEKMQIKFSHRCKERYVIRTYKRQIIIFIPDEHRVRRKIMDPQKLQPSKKWREPCSNVV